jgi:hypothetical protein
MGILSNLSVYGKWNFKSKEEFSSDEIAAVKSAEVVPSEYGHSIKFNLVGGGCSFMPISNTSRAVSVGEQVDLHKCFCITLERVGSADIQRIEVQ